MTESKRPEFNFSEDVAIDLDDLHNEWATHAHKRKKYADEVAWLDQKIKQQVRLTDVKKSQLKKEEARVIIAIKILNSKATVQQIEAEIMLSNDDGLKVAALALSDAEQEKINMEYDLNIAKNALKAMDDKKEALENEVALWSRNYFATPRERRDIPAGKIIENEIAGQKAEVQRTEINRRRSRREK